MIALSCLNQYEIYIYSFFLININIKKTAFLHSFINLYFDKK